MVKLSAVYPVRVPRHVHSGAIASISVPSARLKSSSVTMGLSSPEDDTLRM